MSEYEPYSKRQRQVKRAGSPVLYRYDELPDGFRVQAYYAIVAAIGRYSIRTRVAGHFEYGGSSREPYQNAIWRRIEQEVSKEKGVLELSSKGVYPDDKLVSYLRSESDPERVLDAVEIAFRLIQTATQGDNDDKFSSTYQLSRQLPDAIQELNRRFRQHDLGYKYVGSGNLGVIIRVDSQFIHAEVVEPAIATLHAEGFKGPLDEFLKAHQEFRYGHHKDAMNEALKAFESTMKSICGAKNWPVDADSTAKVLIRLIFDKGLVPNTLESYFAGIRTILGSGVPTLRNKSSGHGQGSSVVEVPDYLAAFTLHLTAANIVFLMDAFKASSPST
jgi:hypothetical protein